MKHKLLIFRTESAEMEVEADSPKEAREKAANLIDNMDSWADFESEHLTSEWEQDGGIRIESVE